MCLKITKPIPKQVGGHNKVFHKHFRLQMKALKKLRVKFSNIRQIWTYMSKSK